MISFDLVSWAQRAIGVAQVLVVDSSDKSFVLNRCRSLGYPVTYGVRSGILERLLKTVESVSKPHERRNRRAE